MTTEYARDLHFGEPRGLVNAAQTSRLRLNLRRSWLARLPVLALFLWYLFYTGLAPVLPVYERLDDLLLVFMLLVSAVQVVVNRGRLRMPRGVALGLILINGVIFSSSLLHPATWPDVPEFAYRANRTFIVLLYVFACAVDADQVIRQFVTICRVLLVLNLPALLYNLGRYNVRILQAENNDFVAGFFPFSNNDSITMLLVVLTLFDAHAVLFRGRLRQIWLLAFEYFLLLAMMNFKVAVMVTGALALAAILRSRHRVQYTVLFACIAFLPALLVVPSIIERIPAIQNSPVIVATTQILGGEVTEYNWLVGTGPGSFTSPMAFSNARYLTEKYGLLAKYLYWTGDHQRITGTLTRWTSSALALLGEIGFVGALAYVLVLLTLTWQCLQNVRNSPASLLGFAAGLYVVPVGIFLDSWTWGYEVLLLMLGAKAAADWRLARLRFGAVPREPAQS